MRSTYGHKQGIEGEEVKPTFFVTNGLTVPTLSFYLGVPIEPIYSPEWRELERMALERLSAKTGERKEK